MENETITATGAGEARRTMRRRVTRIGVLSGLITAALVLALVSTAYASTGGGGGKITVSVNPGEGTTGSSVTVQGDGLPPGDPIAIGYASGSCSGAVTPIDGATGTTNASGSVTVTFTWPSTPTGDYVICATDQTTHTKYKSQQPFQALPQPTLTISSPVYSSQAVTVTGAHFLPTGSQNGGTVDVLYGDGGSNGCTTLAGNATVNPDGSFTFTFNAPNTSVNKTITIVAVEPQGTCGQTNPGPTMQAQANATVSPAAAIKVTDPITSGGQATVTGQYFLPAGSIVEVDYGLGKGANACSTKAGTATVNPDGTFSFTFKAPSVSSDTPITVAAVEPQGGCAQPQLRAVAAATVKAQPTPFPWLQYCLIPLLLLLLLLLLLFLVFRRRKKDEPVTIEERDRVYVPDAGGAGGGTALIDRQIIARDARGKEVVIAEEVTTVEEEEEELP
jgi:hypothetical protein